MDYTITRTRIIGTSDVVYAAWEAYDGHSSYRHEHGVKLGKVTSRRVPTDLDALTGDERYVAVTAWLGRLKTEAVEAVLAQYPFLEGISREAGGEIHVRVEDEHCATCGDYLAWCPKGGAR